jgi:endonuclease/exonuclease/phosphatase family metal-dependent hydrolase
LHSRLIGVAELSHRTLGKLMIVNTHFDWAEAWSLWQTHLRIAQAKAIVQHTSSFLRSGGHVAIMGDFNTQHRSVARRVFHRNGLEPVHVMPTFPVKKSSKFNDLTFHHWSALLGYTERDRLHAGKEFELQPRAAFDNVILSPGLKAIDVSIFDAGSDHLGVSAEIGLL